MKNAHRDVEAELLEGWQRRRIGLRSPRSAQHPHLAGTNLVENGRQGAEMASSAASSAGMYRGPRKRHVGEADTCLLLESSRFNADEPNPCPHASCPGWPGVGDSHPGSTSTANPAPQKTWARSRSSTPGVIVRPLVWQVGELCWTSTARPVTTLTCNRRPHHLGKFPRCLRHRDG